MKSESYTLVNPNVLNIAIIRLKELPCDGKLKLTISNAGDKSSLQHGLYWMWNTDVGNSGMGSYDTKEGVHLAAKRRWAIPILMRDDETFSDLYLIWKKLYGKDEERMTWFADKQVSTSMFTVHQMAEYLTDYQRFYLGHGVPLRDPDDLKLLAYEGL